MTLKPILFVVAFFAVSGCTGAQVYSGSTPLEEAVVIYWHCDDGVLGAHWKKTDASGTAIWNPYDSNTDDFDVERVVPAGKVVVTVEHDGISRQRIINHAFNAKCDIPWNGTMQSLDCSKDGFSVTASVDTWSVAKDAPVYKMPTQFNWSGGAPVIGIPGSSNMLFPAEWPASCRSTASVGTKRGAIQFKMSLSNVR
ncbi:MAG: hypothetical protein JNM17_38705 [Archangium sp.]|nr:hypothetical protein [Archangium sp.]